MTVVGGDQGAGGVGIGPVEEHLDAEVADPHRGDTRRRSPGLVQRGPGVTEDRSTRSAMADGAIATAAGTAGPVGAGSGGGTG